MPTRDRLTTIIRQHSQILIEIILFTIIFGEVFACDGSHSARNVVKWLICKLKQKLIRAYGKRNAPRNYNAFILLSNDVAIAQNFKGQFGTLGFLGRMVRI
jgi:hypothetical protein